LPSKEIGRPSRVALSTRTQSSSRKASAVAENRTTVREPSSVSPCVRSRTTSYDETRTAAERARASATVRFLMAETLGRESSYGCASSCATYPGASGVPHPVVRS
jgi:hypothetical protein